MKKNYIFTLLLVFYFSNLSFGQEMLLNGDFENWDDDTTPTSWTKVENITKESTEIHGGSFSAKHVGGTKKLAQTIEGVIAGNSYTMTLWYKVTGGDDTDARIWSYWKNAAGDSVNDADTDASLRGPSNGYLDNNGGAWTKYEVTVIAPAEVTKLYFELRAYGSATVYYDDLSFVNNTAAAVIDPMDDFEGNGNITWAADTGTGMDIAFANPSSTGINTSATVLEYSDTGTEYANINFDLSTDTSIKYDLTTKNVFTLKVFVPTPDVAVTSAKTLALKLQDHSSATPWVGQQAVTVAYEYDVWQELTFDFSAHSAATNFSRIVVQFNGEGNTEVVKAYIDDLSYGEAATAGVESNVLLGFSMYPNPASNRLNISATETIQNAEIYNILGKNVMSVNVNDTKVSLDISNLASGIYIVKYNANDKIGTAKFIKK